MLPGGDGMDICRRLRAEHGVTVPILLLTARAEEADRIAGLNVGADDYVVKPFSPGELVARVRAQLRRVEIDTSSRRRPRPACCAAARSSWIRSNRTGEVLRPDRSTLTSKEFDLLHYLMAHPGQAFSRDELLDAVWDRDYFGDAEHRDRPHPPPAREDRARSRTTRRMSRSCGAWATSSTRRHDTARRPGRWSWAWCCCWRIVVAAVVAERLMGAPRGDVVQLAIFLSVSGIVSLLIGAAAVRWASHRLGSLRNRLTIAFGAGPAGRGGQRADHVGADVHQPARPVAAVPAVRVFGGRSR